jgi:hypothetical protein
MAMYCIKNMNRSRSDGDDTMLTKLSKKLKSIEKEYLFEKKLLYHIKIEYDKLISLQKNIFLEFQINIDKQNDLNLDVMSMFEQELDGWKTIAFEGPRSTKGIAMKKSVNKTHSRRIEKEMLKEQSNALFDGTVHKKIWNLFINITNGIIGRGKNNIQFPSKFRRRSNDNEDEVKEEEQQIMEEETMTLFIEEKEEKHETKEELQEEEKENNQNETYFHKWSVQDGLDHYRQQFIKKMNVRTQLQSLIIKRISNTRTRKNEY